MNRRALLASALGLLAPPARAQATDEGEGPTPIAVRATPIERFAAGGQARFGALSFRSGLELQANEREFGGFSGLWRSGDGGEIVAITDRARWLTARVALAGGRLAGLNDAVLAPMLGASGRPLRRSRFYDTEALTLSGGTAFVAVERSHGLLRFPWAKEGVRARAQAVPGPAELRDLPSNQGLEAIGVAPPRSPLSGALVAIAERARRGDGEPTRGFVLSGPRAGAFDVARTGPFDVTDLAFLPSGEMLLLERRFSWLGGLGARIRRIPADAVAAGRTVDGPAIFEADGSQEIDNLEGLSIHRGPGSETVLTLISDDNFSALQRTLLLEFTLDG
jgi:hypothetical protein